MSLAILPVIALIQSHSKASETRHTVLRRLGLRTQSSFSNEADEIGLFVARLGLEEEFSGG